MSEAPALPAPSPKYVVSQKLAYILAVLLAVSFILFRLWLEPWLGDNQLFLVFLIPVTFAAYWGGVGPGMTATFLVAMASGYLFIPKSAEPTDNLYHIINWGLLIVTGVIVTVLCEALHRSKKESTDSFNQLRETDGELIRSLKENYDLRAAIDQHAIVAVTDARGTITYANSKFCEISGYSHDELIGNNHRILASGLHTREFFDTMWKTISAGHTWTGEIRNRAKDGSHYWVQTTIAPLVGAGGKVRQYIAIRTDVTKLKLAEQRVRAQEAELRTIFEHINEGVIVVGLDGRFTHLNRAAIALFGFASEDEGYATADELSAVLEFTSLDGALVDPENRPSSRVLRGELLHREVIRIRRYESGWTGLIEFGGTLVKNTDGSPLMGVLTMTDVTARHKAEEKLKASEAHLRSFVENAPVSLAMFDRNMDFIANSRRWMEENEKGTGELIGKNYYIVHPDMPQGCRDLHHCGLEGEHIAGEDQVWSRPDGSKGYRKCWVGPWRDHEGRIGGVVVMTQDLTRQRVLEKELAQAQKMEAVGTLAGGIAHDFNNILGAIIGFAELTKMRLADQAKAAEYLDLVLQAGSRGSALVRQILTFSRQQSQELVPLQLRLIVAEPLKLLRASLPASIEIKQSLPTNLPLVMADPTQVHQVVMNLCTNAWHAMKDRPGVLEARLEEVHVSASQAVAIPDLYPGNFVRLTVSDTGHGMDDETLKRAFEPFFTTKPPGEGTGLGLSVVHGIVRLHKGAVNVISEEGRGTTFEVYFPALATQSAVAEIPTEKAPQGHGQKVLFVDDEKPISLVGHHFLEDMGYVVDSRTDPVQALERFRHFPDEYQVVVTDLNMPSMSGVDLATELLKIRPGLPLVLITGNPQQFPAEKAVSLGFNQVLAKPFNSTSLGLAVHRALTGGFTPS